jgi:hypothetical protein
MSKPSAPVGWATTPGTRLEPTSPEKAAAFSNGFQPPARWHNWLFGLLGDWTSYLNNLHGDADFLGQSYTWTATHVFQDTFVSVPPRYTSSIARQSWLSMGHAIPGPGAGYLQWDDELSVKALTGFVADTVQIVVPFRLPAGSALTKVTVACFHGGATNLTWRVVKRANTLLGANRTTTQAARTVTATSGNFSDAPASSYSNTALETAEYFVEFEFSDSNSSVQGVLVEWNDVGTQSQVR